jgi:hypothetical protein
VTSDKRVAGGDTSLKDSQQSTVDSRQPLAATPRSRPNLLIALVPILLVVITFLFWYQTWFGSPLSEEQMGEYLTNTSAPHKTQHALAQLSDRIARGDARARRWYPQLLVLARSKEAQFRVMAAWAMGQDNHSEEFHRALRTLVSDPEPLVRWNAALALARFGDGTGEPQLRAMLEPYTLVAPRAGKLEFRLKEHEAVSGGGVVARIRPNGPGSGGPMDVVSPALGEVERRMAEEGTQVSAGDALAVISPGESQAWEALRALYLVGQPQSLDDVERFVRGVPNMPDKVRQQAIATAQAIQQRSNLRP